MINVFSMDFKDFLLLINRFLKVNIPVSAFEKIKIAFLSTCLADPAPITVIIPSEAKGATLTGLITCSVCAVFGILIFILDVLTIKAQLQKLKANVRDGWRNVKDAFVKGQCK